jgi:hypothetical protein
LCHFFEGKIHEKGKTKKKEKEREMPNKAPWSVKESTPAIPNYNTFQEYWKIKTSQV